MISKYTAVLLAAAFAAHASAENAAIFTRAEVFAYSDTLPIHALFNDLEGPYHSGGVAFTHDKVEIGAQYGQFSLAALYRYDYYLDFSRDTFEVVYRNKHGLPLDPNRQYNLRLDANHFLASGLKLAWETQPLSGVTIHAALSYLEATDLVKGDIRGHMTSSADSYTGQVNVDYAYEDDLLFDRHARSADGKGYAVDLAIAWSVNEKLELRARFEDLASRIVWDDAPYTRALVTSATTHFDSDGFLHAAPVLTGIEGYRREVQRLPVRATLAADYALNDLYTVGVSVFQVESTTLPRLQLQRSGGSWGDLSLSYDWVAQAVGISYRKGPFEVAYTADEWDYKDARLLGLRLGFRLPL